METPRPHWIDRLADTLRPVEIRNPSRHGDRIASVLLAILGGTTAGPAGARLLGIVRSDVGRHGGQFALPGGRPEEGDTSLFDTAIREAREEVGLHRPVTPVGTLGEFNTWVSRFRVRVHVGWLPEPDPWVPQDSEVAAVLEVPVADLVALHGRLPRVGDVWHLPIEHGYEFDPEACRVAGRVPPRGRGHRLEREGRQREMPYVWGLTARVIYAFLERAWIPALGPTEEPRQDDASAPGPSPG